MSNHFHVVLKVDSDRANKEVLTIWHKDFKDTLLSLYYVKDGGLNESELKFNKNEGTFISGSLIYDSPNPWLIELTQRCIVPF